MVLWRISRFIDLKGIGGLRSNGRWHEAGLPVVYFAGSPAGALLEVCVHTSSNDAPPTYTLQRVEGPDLECESILLESLPPDWATKPGITRELGDKWLREKASVVLKVPSAILPQTCNYVFNPMHPDASQFTIVQTYTYPFDMRIKR
ncbi:MAG TPA: RES family NAD+ phosphorylase [Terracidiphilus sp.]|jgi:RES domain-containing protein